MKKFLKYLLAGTIIVVIAMGIYVYTSGYGIEVHEKGIKSDVFLKGFENAVALEKDEKGNYFIAYEKEIVKINKENMTESIYTNGTLNIEDILYFNNNLIILSNDNLFKFNLEEKNITRIIKDIPYGNEKIQRKILEKDGKVLLAIGAFTNTGIAEPADLFTKALWDESPIDLTLNGVNYNGTGAFKPYGKASKEDEKIKAKELGNAAIYEIDVEQKKAELYASGIKNVMGMDKTSGGELVCAVEGLNKEGERGALRDSDYIYKINKGVWYGWPDYSGGDPISSPKFIDEGAIKSVIKNPVEKNVLGPYYEHNKVNGIKNMAIDREGVILEEDTILFFDKVDNKIYSLDKKKNSKEFLKLNKNSDIKEILFLEDECLILDSNSGYIYKLEKNKINFIKEIPKSIVIVVIIITLGVLLVSVNKIMKRKR